MSRRQFLGLSASAVAGLAVAGCASRQEGSADGSEPLLITTLGALALSDVDVMLPHEHIFLDSRPGSHPQHAHAMTDDVVEVMQPKLVEAAAAGVSVMVDATAVGLGRRADIVLAVSRAARMPVLVPTGLYCEPTMPGWAVAASQEALRDWMVGELTDGIEATGVTASWIKLCASDDGLTGQEQKALRAAVRAGEATHAAVGCHLARGIDAREALDIVERSGYRAERFIWIHADLERDRRFHKELARRGAWVEFDQIGGEARDDTAHVEMIQGMLDAGLGSRLLLSMDSGWYDAGPRGSECRPDCIKGYTYLTETFLPKLREAGIDEKTLRAVTRDNPFQAYARRR